MPKRTDPLSHDLPPLDVRMEKAIDNLNRILNTYSCNLSKEDLRSVKSSLAYLSDVLIAVRSTFNITRNHDT